MSRGQKTRGEDALTPQLSAERSILAGLQETRRILRHAIQAHFEMQVRAGRAAAGSYGSNTLPSNDQVAIFDENRRVVRVTTYQAVAVVDLDEFTIGRMHLGQDHLAARRSNDGGSDLGWEIDALVKAFLA